MTATTVIAMLNETCQVTGAFVSGWMTHRAFIRCNRSSFLSSHMALIAIAVLTVQGIICWTNRASHCMTSQTKRFIHHSRIIVLNRYGGGCYYIRAVIGMTATTVIAMLSKTCQVTGAFVSGWMTHRASTGGYRSPFLSSHMARIAIAVLTVQGIICWTNWASHCMTGQTKRFIHHSRIIVLNRYGGGCYYIRAVIGMTATTVIAMLSKTCQVTGAFVSGWVAHRAFIRGNRSSFLSSCMALIAITVLTVQGTVCRANGASHCMTGQTKRLIHHSPGLVLNRYGGGGSYVRAVVAMTAYAVTFIMPLMYIH
jgi:hypothetical protein